MCVCNYSDVANFSDCTTDSNEQLEEFRNDPAKLAQYSRDIEGELSKRFTLVNTALRSCQKKGKTNKWRPDAQDE
jgi:hypothetical protein